ncbi:MAG TPA: hypothetical protein VH370_08760 [Humisphaera sp.]|jgi:hypothetical protein|nr:hypothetical protein [Humisphaera sp.]
MKLLHVLAIVSTLSIGGFALIGCQSSDQNLPANENGTTAGGNGAFGESPENPGVYQRDDVSHTSADHDSGAGTK